VTNNYKLGLLVETLQEACKGEKQPFQEGYKEDVINRLPAIEKALSELKVFLED
jgi:hypothetical protein